MRRAPLPWQAKTSAEPPHLHPIYLSTSKALLTTDTAANRIRPIIKRHIGETQYDITPYIVDAIEKNDANFEFDSTATFQRYGSSNCIGLSLQLLTLIVLLSSDTLTPISRPPIYVIPSTLPAHFGVPSDQFGHVALLMNCRDGIILIDSGFHIPEPIVLKKNQPWTFKNHQFTFQCQWSGGNKIAAQLTTNRYGTESFEYVIQRISNPDQAITQHQTVDRPNLSYVERNESGEVTRQIKVNQRKEQIEASDAMTGNRTCIPIDQLQHQLSKAFETLKPFSPLLVTSRILIIAMAIAGQKSRPTITTATSGLWSPPPKHSAPDTKVYCDTAVTPKTQSLPQPELNSDSA